MQVRSRNGLAWASLPETRAPDPEPLLLQTLQILFLASILCLPFLKQLERDTAVSALWLRQCLPRWGSRQATVQSNRVLNDYKYPDITDGHVSIFCTRCVYVFTRSSCRLMAGILQFTQSDCLQPPCCWQQQEGGGLNFKVRTKNASLHCVTVAAQFK